MGFIVSAEFTGVMFSAEFAGGGGFMVLAKFTGRGGFIFSAEFAGRVGFMFSAGRGEFRVLAEFAGG